MKFADLSQILHQQCLVDDERPIVLGFSGGPDSLSLLNALNEGGFSVIVAHLNHGLRPESKQEKISAETVAKSYNAPFFGGHADVASYAKQESLSIEEAARKLRYEFLFRIAVEQRAQAVAVAHNADDQVETVLMHLLRGAGPRGLSGMPSRALPNPWSDSIPLIRPLLGFWRQEVENYCTANGLHPVLDPSNRDTTFFRNRLRLDLIPGLEKFSPGIKRRLYQTADILAEESDIVNQMAAAAWRFCLTLQSDDIVQLNRTCLLENPIGIQRILIRRAAETLRPGLRDLDFSTVQRAIDLVSSPLLAPQDWLDGLCLLIEGDHVWIADWSADLPIDWPQAPESVIHIETPGVFELNSWHLELREDANLAGAKSNIDPFQAWLHQESLGDELILRRRLPGDRFQPLGLETGSMKLADFMINEKLPKRAREGWPLLCKGDEIVWVPGYQLAHPFRLLADSKRVVHLTLSRA